MDELTKHVRQFKENLVITGRATTALWLLLNAHSIRNRAIVLPVNICYSLVRAVVLSGNHPRFVDVDPDDGNVRLADLDDVWASRPYAIVMPHNLGNPSTVLPAVAQRCVKEDVMLVEDCAASPLGSLNGQPVGSWGRYVLFSFGAGKTADAGLGGAIAANDPLDTLDALNQSLPEFNETLAEKTAVYAALFRTIYHSRLYDALLPGLAAFHQVFDPMYQFRLTEQQRTEVPVAFRRLLDQRQHRDRVFAEYENQLPFDHKKITRFPTQPGACLWRYNLLVEDAELRGRLIRRWLDDGVGVSAWYPPIHRLYDQPGPFPGAERFATRIINLPLNGSIEATQAIVTACREVVA